MSSMSQNAQLEMHHGKSSSEKEYALKDLKMEKSSKTKESAAGGFYELGMAALSFKALMQILRASMKMVNAMAQQKQKITQIQTSAASAAASETIASGMHQEKATEQNAYGMMGSAGTTVASAAAGVAGDSVDSYQRNKGISTNVAEMHSQLEKADMDELRMRPMVVGDLDAPRNKGLDTLRAQLKAGTLTLGKKGPDGKKIQGDITLPQFKIPSTNEYASIEDLFAGVSHNESMKLVKGMGKEEARVMGEDNARSGRITNRTQTATGMANAAGQGIQGGFQYASGAEQFSQSTAQADAALDQSNERMAESTGNEEGRASDASVQTKEEVLREIRGLAETDARQAG